MVLPPQNGLSLCAGGGLDMTRPSPGMLYKLLRYDPNTGKIFWLKRDVDLFSDGNLHSAETNCRRWNTRFAGKEAFTSINGDGYYQGSIFCRTYSAHRVIWAMETGAWPVDQIDHKDHVRTHNRMANLRKATSQTNNKNQSMRTDNTSGHTGISWHKTKGKWLAYIKMNSQQIHLGYFHSKNEAIAVRSIANDKYGYHVNHGED